MQKFFPIYLEGIYYCCTFAGEIETIANMNEIEKNNQIVARADYGKQIVSAVSTQLQTEYGKKGLEPCSVWRMSALFKYTK